MIFKNFRTQIFLRVLLISFSLFAIYFLVFRTQLYVTIIMLGVLTISQIFALIFYIEKINRNVIRFLEAIRYADFSQSFSNPGLGSVFDQLNSTFSKVMEEFRQIRREKEENYRFLLTIVQHIGIGLIAFDQHGKVELINTSAKKLLRVIKLKKIDKLKKVSINLFEVVHKIKPGDKAQVKISNQDELLQLVIYATGFKKEGSSLTLISIQNIQSELEEQEMEAWQKLIRVLTHEIMNSVTPISSLAGTASDILKDYPEISSVTEIEQDSINDVRNAVNTIKKRSEGLIHFVQAYRNLTRLPKPNFQIISISQLFQTVSQLMFPQLSVGKIDLFTKISPESLEITADPDLIEQVLINLLRNSAEALAKKGNGKIELNAQMDARGRVILEVHDNGSGIAAEALEKIFIPFFTTKKQGSGIGLSLSRQIMRLHRGNISVLSEPNVSTVVRLIF